MLPADEIIQQKEWHQLSADEKTLVAELADSEAEYNLLKKMLMVSSEAITEVPAVNEHVYQNIKATLPANRKKTSSLYWYAAAAAVLVLILSVLFVLKKEDAPAFVNIPVTPVEVKPAIKEVLPAEKDSIPVLVEKKRLQKAGSSPVKHQPVFPSLQNDDPQNYVAVNTSVSHNASLLDLVTEVE